MILKENNIDENIKVNELIEEYLAITEEDDDEQVRLKTIIQSLDRVDIIVLLLYTHYGSERKTAKALNVSRSPINRRLKKIRKEIKDKLCI